MHAERSSFTTLGALLLGAGCAAQVVDAVDLGNGAAAGRSSVAGSGGARGGDAGKGGQDCSGACCSAPNDDRDGDGTPDCEDGCPDQPDKQEPGICGCDLPDEDRADAVACTGLRTALVHRYSFEGTGDVAWDTAGLVEDSAAGTDAVPADGVLINTSLSGSGRVNLAGGMNGNADDDQYVGLPAGLLSRLESVTIEAWLIWYGGLEWQRIFDFGNNDSPVPGLQGSLGTSYLFLTPGNSVFLGNQVRVAYKREDYQGEVVVDSERLFPRGVDTHVAVTFDLASGTLALYLDGAREASLADVDAATGIPMRLEVVDDVYNWLGRSQFGDDAELAASLDELRVYAAALTPAQIRTSQAAGPNPYFFPNE